MKALIIFLCLITGVVESKEFSNQYLSFRLPNGWECQLEGTEWVCQSYNKERSKEAIIIMAAKTRGEKDDLGGYQDFLSQPRNFKLPGGTTQISEPKFTKKKKIEDQVWIDSLHLASEVPGFYTRYLATVKGNLGVALTLSVSKNNYLSYSSLFESIIKSLRVHERTSNQKDYRVVARKDDLIEKGIFAGEGISKLGSFTQNEAKPSLITAGPKTYFLGLILLVSISYFGFRKKR
jgi:hypothetical protein